MVAEADGTFTNVTPFDDRVRIPDDSSSPPFVGTLSSTVSLPAGLNLSGSMTLDSMSEIDSVDRDPQTGAVSAITMKGRAACNFALGNSLGPRRFRDMNLNAEYDAGKGVVIGAGGAVVSISASISVSRLFAFGTSRAGAKISVLNGNTLEEFEIRDTNVDLQSVDTAFSRTVVMPAGGSVLIHLDADAECQVSSSQIRFTQSQAAEATFTITVVPN